MSATGKKIEAIKADLFSQNDATVKKALLKCEEEGNASLVEPLIVLFGTTTNEDVKKSIAEMLSSLKVSNVEDHFLKALADPELNHIRKDLLFFMWSSGLQPVNGMPVVTQVAVNGSYDETLESLTLLESLDGEIPEEGLLESIAIVKQYLGQSKPDDRNKLLLEYLNTLEHKRAED